MSIYMLTILDCKKSIAKAEISQFKKTNWHKTRNRNFIYHAQIAQRNLCIVHYNILLWGHDTVNQHLSRIINDWDVKPGSDFIIECLDGKTRVQECKIICSKKKHIFFNDKKVFVVLRFEYSWKLNLWKICNLNWTMLYNGLSITCSLESRTMMAKWQAQKE